MAWRRPPLRPELRKGRRRRETGSGFGYSKTAKVVAPDKTRQGKKYILKNGREEKEADQGNFKKKFNISLQSYYIL